MDPSPVSRVAANGWALPDVALGLTPALPPDVTAAPAPPAPPVPLSLRLRPRTFTAILDSGFDLLTFRWLEIMAVTAVIMLPLYALPQVLATTARYSALDQLDRTAGSIASDGPWSALAGSGLGGWQLATILGSMASIALVGVAVSHLATGWIVGGTPTIGSALRLTWRRSWVVLVAMLISLPLRLLGVLACGVGLVLVLAWLLMLSPVIASEGMGPVASMKRSARLANRRWWPVLSVVCFGGVIVGLAQALMGIIVGAVIGAVFDSQAAIVLATGVLSLALSLLFTPLHAAWSVLAYLDVRVRTEGIDLDPAITALRGAATR